MSEACRICLKVSNHIFSLKELTDEVKKMNKNDHQFLSYCEMYNYCTKLNAKVNDDYPQALCFFCANNLIISYKTITAAIESERNFLNQLVDKKNLLQDKDTLLEIKISWPQNDNLNVFDEINHNNNDSDEDVHQDYEYLEETDEMVVVYDDASPKHKYSQKLLQIEPIGENYDIVKIDKLERLSDNRNVFNCSICDTKFFSQIVLNCHMKNNHSGDKNDETEILNENLKTLNNETNIDNKNPIDENEELLEEELLETLSNDGNDQFPDDDSLNKSQEDYNSSNESEISYKNEEDVNAHKSCYCSKCKRQFKTKQSFSNHMRRTHKNDENEENRCELCGKKAKNLLNHKKIYHSIPIVCKICNKELCTEKNLKIHMRGHHGKSLPKTIPCPKCNKFFPSLINLKYHLQTHDLNRERKFECELCGKKFFNKTFYNSHLITHTKQEFPCPICGKVLSRKLSLASHIKLHDGGNIKCDQCDKTFTTRANLQIHMRFHTKDFPFVCEICGRRFPMRGHLTYHMDKHTGVVFNCSVCDKQFTSRACLREHSFVHIGMPIECNLCGKGYPNKYRFKYHLKKSHKLINPNLESLDRVHIGKFAGTKIVKQFDAEENMN